MSRALIIGAGGQDGSYLAEYLSAEGKTQVFAMLRRSDHPRASMLRKLPNVHVILGDLLDSTSLVRALRLTQPHEIYNTAAVLAPRGEWASRTPPLILETTGVAPARLLDMISGAVPDARLVHASSSAIYNPEKYGAYGAAKKLAHDAVAGYRRHADSWASNVVFFSHTSPRQPEHFLIRRLVRTVVDVADGRKPSLCITNMANRRDWGWAPDFIRGLVAVARADDPGDFVVRSGTLHSVQDVLLTAASMLGLDGPRLLAFWPNASRIPDESETDTPAAQTPPGWKHETTFTEMIKKLIEFEVSCREA